MLLERESGSLRVARSEDLESRSLCRQQTDCVAWVTAPLCRCRPRLENGILEPRGFREAGSA